MKKIILSLIAVLAVAFTGTCTLTSCNGDDNPFVSVDLDILVSASTSFDDTMLAGFNKSNFSKKLQDKIGGEIQDNGDLLVHHQTSGKKVKSACDDVINDIMSEYNTKAGYEKLKLGSSSDYKFSYKVTLSVGDSETLEYYIKVIQQ